MPTKKQKLLAAIKSGKVKDVATASVFVQIEELKEKIDEELPNIKNIISKVKGEKGETGPKGDKGDSIIGPKGQDGQDGRDGKDGKTPDENQIVAKTTERVKTEVLPLIPEILDLEKEIPQLGQEIRDGLELLTKDERLDWTAIQGIDDYPEISKLARQPKTISGGGGGYARTFYQLFDVPQSYAGQALKSLRVKSTEDGLEFFTGSGLIDWGEIGGTLSGQTDLQTALDLKAPLASPTFTTQIITPLVIGGAATTSDLTLQTTSGVGATGADMHFLVGNNGATEAMTILNNGNVGIGTVAPSQKLDLVGSLELENTTTSTTGVIYKGADRFIHNFQHPTGSTAVPDGMNTFVGVNAGNFTMGSTATSTSHASYNTGIGYQALQANTIGYDNSAMGMYALYSNTTGYQNLAMGYAALYSNTTGYQNLALGRAALFRNQTGDYNTVVGGYAGYGASGNSFDNNSLFGAYAGYGLTTGSSNVFLGYYAGRYQTTNSNLLIIDNQSRTSAALEATNALIYGTFAADPVNQKLKFNATTSTTNQATTLGAGVTTFAIKSNVMTITGDGGGNTIATITGANSGTLLTLIFVDALVTITDTDAHTANTVDLSAAFTGADDTTLQLVYDGTSWYETSRSVN